MCENHKDNKGVFLAQVRYNEPIGDYYYRLSLEFSGKGAASFAKAKPGQFLEIKVNTLSTPAISDIPEHLRDTSRRNVLLRRPFSFVDIQTVDENKTVVDIIYLVTGASTVRMTTLSPQDELSVTGPLGNGFSIDNSKDCVILVAGGVGVPPIEHVANWLVQNRKDVKILAFIGARSKAHLPFASTQRADAKGIEELESIGVETFVTTDDGSFGDSGFVTDRLSKWLSANKIVADKTLILSCGPEPMLKNLSKLAEKSNIDTQVSLERIMACGIGLCQSCAVEVNAESKGQTNNNTETTYKLCCKDGPVFNSKEVIW